MSKIILKGEKVILRPLSLKDAPDYCRWLADPEVTKFLSFYEKKPPTLKEEREWISEAKLDKSKLNFAIDAVDGEHIGTVSFASIDRYARKAEFGIFIGDKKYWGQGCGTEACRLIVEYGFRKMKLHRIYLRHIAYNIRGHKAYTKVGFKVEGCLRDHVYRDGYWHDEIRMSMLKNEYLPAGRQGLNNNKKKYGKRSGKN